MSNPKIKAIIALSDPGEAARAALVLAHRGVLNPLVVSSTHEAIDAMVDTSFHLFVVDAKVPATLERPGTYGGIDFIRFIRMCEGSVSRAVVTFMRTKVGDITMLEAQDEIVEAKAAGATCLLAHPVTLEKFDDIVQPALEAEGFLAISSENTVAHRRLGATACDDPNDQ